MYKRYDENHSDRDKLKYAYDFRRELCAIDVLNRQPSLRCVFFLFFQRCEMKEEPVKDPELDKPVTSIIDHSINSILQKQQSIRF